MKLTLAFATVIVLTLAVTLLSLGTGKRAAATGTGPTIALGAPSGITVPVNATTAAADPFGGFNLHVIAVPGAGVTLTSIGSNATDSIIHDGGDPNSTFCVSDSPQLTERLFACTNITGFSTTGTGLLASFVLNAAGDGCVTVILVEREGDNALDTYTVNAEDNTAQSNVVDDTPLHVLIGAGTLADCLPPPTPTPTVTLTATPVPPTATNTPLPPTATPCGAPGCPTPGGIATDTPVPPPGATPTNTPDPSGEIHLLAISANLCLVFVDSPPLECFDAWRPGSQLSIAADVSGGAPQLPPRDCPSNTFTPCRLQPSDFAAADVDANQLHALDPAVTQFGGGLPGLYILAFVPSDGPVQFRTNKGLFANVADSPGPFTATSNVYDCTGQFEDCDGDGQSLTNLIVVPLGGYGAALGPGRITVSQGDKNKSLDFTVVGEPASITLEATASTIENGVTDIDDQFGNDVPDGDLDDAGECPFPPPDDASFDGVEAQADRTVIIARVRDAAGTLLAQAWVHWSGDGRDPLLPEPGIGAIGHLALFATPSLQLPGGRGIGAPQVLCGTGGTGVVTVMAELSQFVSPSTPLVADPNAGEASATIDITVVDELTLPTATPTQTATPEDGNTPTSTHTATATPTRTATPAPVATRTPTPTRTATATRTSTPRSTSTATPTATTTPVPTSTSTSTPTNTSTSVPANTATATATPASGVCAAADVDGDGRVGVRDLVTVARHLGGSDLRSDVNGDGRVDARDLFAVVRCLGAARA